jgi:hypothetical protein
LLIIAGYLAYNGEYERVFAFAAIGAMCFFIGIRFQVKERLRVNEEERLGQELAEADPDRLSELEFEDSGREMDSRT